MREIPIVLFGGGAVGKSTMAIQFIQGRFIPEYNATVEDVYHKAVSIDGSASVIELYDTAGQQGYGILRDEYIERGKGFILVYSITDKDSLSTAQSIYAEIKRNKDSKRKEFHCMVVGNKTDLAAQRVVTREEGQAFANNIGYPFVEISAKDRLAVEDIFTNMVRKVRGDAPKETQSTAQVAPALPKVVAEAGQHHDDRSLGHQQQQQPQPPPSGSTSSSSKPKPKPKPWWKGVCTML